MERESSGSSRHRDKLIDDWVDLTTLQFGGFLLFFRMQSKLNKLYSKCTDYLLLYTIFPQIEINQYQMGIVIKYCERISQELDRKIYTNSRLLIATFHFIFMLGLYFIIYIAFLYYNILWFNCLVIYLFSEIQRNRSCADRSELDEFKKRLLSYLFVSN